MEVARGWGEGEMGSCLIGVQFQFCRWKYSGDLLQNNVNILHATGLYIYKWLRWSFVSCVSLPQLKMTNRNSLVAQWLRIHLPMQGTRVRALVREDPICRRATKPVCHTYWACALEPTSHNYWARVPQLLKPVRLEPTLRNKRSHRSEKPAHHNE